ncbi:hypothetical protein A1A1_07137 [Planococcus antarcticus DSM 14505]|uniref:Uncharacterized protein n=1 Tax=Planococcus antarcticus DSM 14505 TaxID=1185653 RepID=A0A1C7DFL0_9BACL|nr:hypothetical protein BBH88_07995 [Planococcus antarcticus DSM 14505]EIM07152.1 hypothetical protein A1A1_07137 [Planococcus antarcticus DSM 14505]
MLLHRYASFVAKPLPELSLFNDFAAGAVKRHPRDPAVACDEKAGAMSLATGEKLSRQLHDPHLVGPKHPSGAISSFPYFVKLKKMFL